MTQMNHGSALMRLGERESGTARLEEAIAAYREALQENTRARAARLMTQMYLGLALDRAFAKTGKRVHLDDALEAADGALEEFRKSKAAYYIEKAGHLRAELLAMKGNPKNRAAKK
jgi:tetratricopeptide (TPR) repeat protein